MSETRPFMRYWRIWLVALLGGVLAFASSYLVSPTYASSTRLIIHGQDPNFLSSNGTNNTAQPLTDSTTAKALADTYASIATSRSLATAVVDKLDLDKPDHSSGPIHWIAKQLATAYRCTRGFVSHGFCASPSRRETQIQLVQSTVAAQLGSTGGADAGQPGSYVLEITSPGDSGKQAQQIANAVADELVLASANQARATANTHITALSKRISVLRRQVSGEVKAIGDYQAAHFSTGSGKTKNGQTPGSSEDINTKLAAAQSDLADAEARQTSIQSSLSGLSSGSSAYAQLNAQKYTVRADISGLKAQIAILEKQLLKVSPATANEQLAELNILQTQLDSTQTNLGDLVTDLVDARSEAATVQPDLTRLDRAGRPDYPVSPKRWLYLLIGLLLGALAGGGLTWLQLRRPLPVADGGPADAEVDDAPRHSVVADVVPVREREPELVGAALNGHGPAHHNGAHAEPEGLEDDADWYDPLSLFGEDAADAVVATAPVTAGTDAVPNGVVVDSTPAEHTAPADEPAASDGDHAGGEQRPNRSTRHARRRSSGRRT